MKLMEMYYSCSKSMRRMFAVWACVAVWFASMSFVVKVDGIPDELAGVPLFIKSELDGRTIDSIHVEGGSALLNGTIDGPEWCKICYSYPVEYGVRTYFRAFFPDGNDTVRVTVADYDKGEIVISGKGLNAKYREIDAYMKTLQPMDSVNVRRFIDYVAERTVENRNNPLGAYLASFISSASEPHAWLALYNDLSPEMKMYPAVRRASERIKGMLETVEGKKFKDIKGVNPDGQAVSLSDYVGRGKYVLVDFWAYWCGPCRRIAKEILMPLYEKYKENEKFIIIGIATSGETEKQLEAMNTLNYPWNQLIDMDNVGGRNYGFNSIPYLILFAPDGEIIRRDIHGEDIEKYVDEILAE